MDRVEQSSRTSSSEGFNVDGKARDAIIDISPASKKSSPNVYSDNPARRMANDRAVRIQEEIERRQGDNSVNHLSSDSLNRLKAYADIQKEIREALDGKESVLKHYVVELAAVKTAREHLEALINADIEYYKTGCSKELWTVFSGVVSYTLTFCAGTLLASGLDMPFLSPLVIGVCWTLFERFPPMIRATSWSNKHADKTYPEIMRMNKRIARDLPRQLFGLNSKHFKRGGKPMTAWEARWTYSLWEAWKGKVCSDDLVSHTFTLCYMTRNVLLALFATDTFLKTGPGMTISLGTLALAGSIAGGTGALLYQVSRGCQYRAENPDKQEAGEDLVKSTKIWGAETDLVSANIALIEEYDKALHASEGFGASKREAVADGIRLMEADRDKAIAKSSIVSSICYELLYLFQGKSHPGDQDNGEVSGSYDQTRAGFFAKVLCLLPSAFFITFIVKIFAAPTCDFVQRLGLLLLAPFVLILGFGFRKELQLAVEIIIALDKGMVDVAHYLITGKDKYQDKRIPASSPERSPIFRDKADGSGMQTPESPTSQKLSGKTKPDGTVKNTSSSTSSSEDYV